MMYSVKTLATIAAQSIGFLAFMLIILNAPELIQTEFWTDQCGFGFLNSTFGGYYFETGCK